MKKVKPVSVQEIYKSLDNIKRLEKKMENSESGNDDSDSISENERNGEEIERERE